MPATYRIETYRVTSGWHWRIVGETADYGSEIACSDRPAATQATAQTRGRIALTDLALAAADKAIYESMEGADADAGFDAGEFSGPAHAEILDRELEQIARQHGLTGDELNYEMDCRAAANDGPHGRIE
jgi:hypothetical protein